MQGSGQSSQEGSVPERGQKAHKKSQLNTKVVGGITAMIAAVATVSLYTFWRVDRVQENVELVNQFYVPALKHLNMLGGKWSAYQRSFEQYIGFRKWGRISADHPLPRLPLKKMIDSNLAELTKILDHVPLTRNVPERPALQACVDRLMALATHEPAVSAEIEGLVKNKRFAEAANQYARARQENLAVSQELLSLNREVESRVGLLQLSTEQELRSAQSVMVVLLGASLLFSLIVLFRLQRWLRPIGLWTRVAQEIALRGLSRDIRFPKITRSMPPEISLLTREFTRMGMTVLEREKTIRSQRDKLETLNFHLKDQNEMLRKLGSLNERVLNSMSSGLIVVGADGHVEQFNARYCDLFGVERSQVFGAQASELLSTWPAELVKKWVVDSLDLNTSVTSQRIVLGRRVFDVRVHPLQAQGGRLLLFDDVTQVVEAEQKLEHARKLVLASNLSSQVAHEVRNPLNSMSLQLEMLEEDLTAINDLSARATAVKRVTAVNEQVQRLDRITMRYLDVGRNPTAQTSAERGAVDVHALIERCLGFLAGEIQAARVTVETDFLATPQQAMVAADPDALSQVIFNLIRNAVEAMRDNDDSSRRALAIRTKVGSSLCIRIEDTGPGVSPSIRTRLFEPFVTDKATGHGLGLSLSRQVCIEHGGELVLGSSPEKGGAAFEISLPLLKGGLCPKTPPRLNANLNRTKEKEASDAPNLSR